MTLITQACQGLIFTAVLGAGVKVGTSICLRFEPPAPLHFKDKKRGRRVELQLDARLDPDGMMHRMLVKLRRSLHVEPSTPRSVLDAVDEMLADLQEYSVQYEAFMQVGRGGIEHWSVTSARVCLRGAGMRVLNDLQSLEGAVWASRELEEVMGCIDVVKERLRSRMLALESR